MTVTKADIMLLEARIRGLAPRMNVKLTCVRNTNMADGVIFQWGSNSVQCDADDLQNMMDLLEPQDGFRVTPAMFLQDYLEPFLRKHAQ